MVFVVVEGVRPSSGEEWRLRGAEARGELQRGEGREGEDGGARGSVRLSP